MSSRRSHRKSRLGCLQCKRRKIKCDEAPPPCGNCKKHNIECEYGAPPVYKSRTNHNHHLHPHQQTRSRSNVGSSPLSTATAGSRSPGTLSTSAGLLRMSASLPSMTNDAAAPIRLPKIVTKTSPMVTNASAGSTHGVFSGNPTFLAPATPVAVDILSSFTSTDSHFTSNLALADLELMHQYTSRTYSTLSKNNQHEKIWKDYVPEEALIHPFLMHGILALAALHILSGCSTENPKRRRYAELATMHQQLALTAFRPQLNNVTAANCTAVFAFSCVIAALAFSFSRYVGKSLQEDPLNELLQDFMLFRGVESVIVSYNEHLSKGKLAPLLQRPSVTDALSPDIVEAIDDLRKLNERHVAQYSLKESEAYQEAIRQLRPSFEKSFDNLERVFRWPMVVPESYFDFVRCRRPGALVILAHYSVILHKLDYCWWSQGWGAHLLETIYRYLDEHWRPLIRWPVDRIGLSFLISRPLPHGV
ncbi:hypothetical protein KEM54_002987 [Ascosphaera aggregata]|nr:hypothetical protein KEM54_002987 [Ascosphaera aggregata]